MFLKEFSDASNNGISSSSGFGRLKKYPCIKYTFSFTRSASCSCVSTPSATNSMSRSRDKCAIARTMARVLGEPTN